MYRRHPRSTLFPYTTLFRSKGLVRATRAVVERIAGEAGTAKLYNVTTHFGEKTGRIVVVGAGKRAEYVAERARGIASAAVKSLWRSNARRDRKSTRLNSSH